MIKLKDVLFEAVSPELIRIVNDAEKNHGIHVNFTKWFMEEYRKTFRCSKHIAKWAAGMFVFNYGWKIQKEYQLK